VHKDFLLTKKNFFYREVEKCKICGEDAFALLKDLENQEVLLCIQHSNRDYQTIKEFSYENNENFKKFFREYINININKLENIIQTLSETKSLIYSQINQVVQDTVKKCLLEIRNLTKLKNKLLEENYFNEFNYNFVQKLSLQKNHQICPQVKSHLNNLKRLLSVDVISQNYLNHDLFFFDESQKQLIATNLLTKKISNFISNENFLIDSFSQIVKFSTEEFLVVGKALKKENKVYKLNLVENTIQELEPTPFKVYSPALVYFNRFVYVFNGGEKCLKYSVEEGKWFTFTGFLIGNERIFAHLFFENILVTSEKCEAIFKFNPKTEETGKYLNFVKGSKIFANDTVIAGNTAMNLKSREKFSVSNIENPSNLSSSAEIDNEIFFYLKSGELVSVNKTTFITKIKLL
jgi:hypothetical protein